MRHIPFFAFFVGAALLGSTAAFAVLPLPEPREDVRKLEKPTISYCSEDGYVIGLVDWDGKNDRVWMRDGKARFSGTAKFSRDGERAAFVVFDGADGSYTHYMLELKTGRVTNLTDWMPQDDDIGEYLYPSWSPDGNRIAMVSIRFITPILISSEIYVLDVHNGLHTRLTNLSLREPFHGIPSWSASGRKVAFGALDKPRAEGDLINSEIYVMDSDGSNMVNLTNHPEFDEYPSWSPDGTKIVFHSYRGADWGLGGDLYVMNPDGSGLERLTFDDHFESHVAWTPDSKWIVYWRGDVDGDPTPEGYYRIDVATKERVHIMDTGASGISWVWAGKSRFLSVDPSDKRKEPWGALKKKAESETDKP